VEIGRVEKMVSQTKSTNRRTRIVAVGFVAIIIAQVLCARAGQPTAQHGWIPVPVLVAQSGQQSGQAPQSGVVTQSSRSFVLDALIVAALFGGALFAVCRSSNRT